jgi:hypothetical protein
VPGQLVSYHVAFEGIETPSNFSANVDWGDGRIEPAYVSYTPGSGNGSGSVSFWHSYSTWGNYKVRLMLGDSPVNQTTVEVDLSVATITYQPDPLDPAKTALVVGGVAGVNDQLLFRSVAGGGVQQIYNGYLAGTFSFDGSIVAYGQSGHDYIQVDEAISKPAILFGQDGNDLLAGGGGADLLVGGLGNDAVVGFGARDVLFGGLGADLVSGTGFGPSATSDGSDMLCADFWSFEGDPTSLISVWRRWNQQATYSDRLNNLRYNLSTAVNSSTVFNDFAGDALIGGEDDDWFVCVGFDFFVDAQDYEEGLGTRIHRQAQQN